MKNLQDVIDKQSSGPRNRKKEAELRYLAEAHQASSVFPLGNLVPYENPDFLIESNGKTIGIELTELCSEPQRAEGGKLSKVASAADRRYRGFPNACPIDVVAVFASETEHVRFHKLAGGLASFVYNNQVARGDFDWNECDLPDGYSHIHLFPPRTLTGTWRTYKAFGSSLAPKELIDSRITEKNGRITEYRLVADEVWLLVVNDQFLGAGEVYARPDHVSQWKFASRFDRTLLFSRERDGSGELIELDRA